MTNEQIKQQAISLYRQKEKEKIQKMSEEAREHFKQYFPQAIYLPEKDKFYLGGEEFDYYKSKNWYLNCKNSLYCIYTLEDYGEYLISKGNRAPTFPENRTEIEDLSWLGKLAAKLF